MLLNNITKKSSFNSKAKMTIWKLLSFSISVALANHSLHPLANFRKSRLVIIFFPVKGC